MTGPGARRPRTLRARVAVVAALAVLGVLAATGAALVLAQRAILTENVDETLARAADGVARIVRDGGTVTADDLPSDDVLVQVVDAGGTITSSLPPSDEPLFGDAPLPRDGEIRTVELPADGSARLTARAAGEGTVVAAAPLDDVAESSAALLRGLALGVPLSASVLAALVWWAVGRALRPVEGIRAQVDRITGNRLDERVPEPATAEEIARLARTMNAMLARLQRSAEEQRRFVGDASHELRSPLARMRAELEVDAAHPGSADPEATAASVLTEVTALQRLTEDLLLLARGDSGAPARAVPVDLDDVVGRVVRARADPRVDAGDVRPVQVVGDPEQLERAVRNLLDNAVRHARQAVVVTLREHPVGTAALTVADDGPGIPSADADRVFERFTRLDDARSAGDGGAGLGLAIARDVAERHGGDLVLDPAVTGGARFVLRIPVARSGARPV